MRLWPRLFGTARAVNPASAAPKHRDALTPEGDPTVDFLLQRTEESKHQLIRTIQDRIRKGAREAEGSLKEGRERLARFYKNRSRRLRRVRLRGRIAQSDAISEAVNKAPNGRLRVLPAKELEEAELEKAGQELANDVVGLQISEVGGAHYLLGINRVKLAPRKQRGDEIQGFELYRRKLLMRSEIAAKGREHEE